MTSVAAMAVTNAAQGAALSTSLPYMSCRTTKTWACFSARPQAAASKREKS